MIFVVHRLNLLPLLALCFVIHQAQKTTTVDCTNLVKSFNDRILLPGSPQYVASDGSYFAAFENKLSPSCIFQPQSVHDLSEFVRAIQDPAITDKPQVALRGGGHTAWAGSANIENGITIDLSNLDAIAISHDQKIASIGGGARWATVYATLETQNLAVAGGRVSKVGVGGLTTGGGLSYFSAMMGFVCDNVLNYEVVLASGEIVQANAATNRDLWIALRGGSNNFGIVTKFDFPTFSQGQMWGGAIFYSPDAVPAIFKDFVDFAGDPAPDKKAHLIAGISFSAMQTVGVTNIYHTTNIEKPPSLAPFTDIQPQLSNTLRSDSLLGFANEQSNFTTDGARQWFFTTSIGLNLELMNDIQRLFSQALDPIKDIPGLMLYLIFQPLTEAFLQKSSEMGGNSLGLSPTDGPVVIVLLNSVHVNPADDDTVRNTVLDLIDSIDKLSASRGLDPRYRFTNYGYKTQKILQGYGPESLAHLRATAFKYDPNGFFQEVVSTGFKISHAH